MVILKLLASKAFHFTMSTSSEPENLLEAPFDYGIQCRFPQNLHYDTERRLIPLERKSSQSARYLEKGTQAA